MKFNSIAISFALLTLTGCKNIFETDDMGPDGSTPYTTVAAPAANNVYLASQPFQVKSNFSDKDDVKQIDVNLVRLDGKSGSENVVSFQKMPDIHFYQLDTVFAANTLPAGNYQLTMRSVDGRQNEGTQQINFTIQ